MARSKKSTATEVTIDATELTPATTADINPLDQELETMTDTTEALETETVEEVVYTAPDSSSPYWDYTVEHAMSEEQLGTSYKALAKFYGAYDMSNLENLFNEQIGGNSATLGELYEAFENTKSAFQNEISVANIKSILQSVKEVGCFIQPIELQLHDDGSWSFAGGRNRFTAMMSIFTLMFEGAGADVDNLVDTLYFPVHRARFNPHSVPSSNATRNMTKAEVDAHKFSSKGITLDDLESVELGYFGKEMKLAEAVATMAQSQVSDLTYETTRKVFTSATSSMLSVLTADRKKRLESALRNTPGSVVELANILLSNIDATLDNARSRGITNFALKSTSLAEKLADLSNAAVQEHIDTVIDNYDAMLAERKSLLQAESPKPSKNGNVIVIKPGQRARI